MAKYIAEINVEIKVYKDIVISEGGDWAARNSMEAELAELKKQLAVKLARLEYSMETHVILSVVGEDKKLTVVP